LVGFGWETSSAAFTKVSQEITERLLDCTETPPAITEKTTSFVGIPIGFIDISL